MFVNQPVLFGTFANNVSYSEVFTDARFVARPTCCGFFDVLESDGSRSDLVTLFGPDINEIDIVSQNFEDIVSTFENEGVFATEDAEAGGFGSMIIALTTRSGSSLEQDLLLDFGFDGELVFPIGGGFGIGPGTDEP